MRSPRRRINDDATYEKARENLVRGAARIVELMEHPLTPREQIEAEQRKYDELADMVMAYMVRGWVKINPELRPTFEAQGLIGKDEVL